MNDDEIVKCANETCTCESESVEETEGDGTILGPTHAVAFTALGLYYNRQLIAEQVVGISLNETCYTYCNRLYGVQSIGRQLQAMQLVMQLLVSRTRCGALIQIMYPVTLCNRLHSICLRAHSVDNEDIL